MFIRISPNTGRPVCFKYSFGKSVNWVVVTDLLTDIEEELRITPREWLDAKELTEMEVLAWSAKK